MVLPLMDEKSNIRVDFIFSYSTYERQAIERAVDVKIGGVNVKFASLEDVVIHKIIAGRARDIEDVKVILLKNPNYDARYISKWLREFDRSLKGTFLNTFKKIEKEVFKGK
jgi:predicted nucleotidyltransferase